MREPCTLRPRTYRLPSFAPAAVTATVRPSPRWIRAASNAGAFTVSTSVPGVVGKSPRAAQTYQDDCAPRSSLPGSALSGSVPKSVVRISSTTSEVRHGLPT